MGSTKLDILSLGRTNTVAKTGPNVFTANNVPEVWNSLTNYAQYNVVEYGTSLYRSKVAGNVGNQPDITPNEWERLYANLSDGDAVYIFNGALSGKRMRIGGQWVKLTSDLIGTVTNSMFHWDGVSFTENLGMLLSGYEIRGFDDTAVDAIKAVDVRIGGANKTAGTGDGGDLSLEGGTSAGGVAGKVRLGGFGVVVDAVAAADPILALSEAGQIYYNTTTQRFRYYNGTAWQDLGSGSGGGGGDFGNITEALYDAENGTPLPVYFNQILDTYLTGGLGTLVNLAVSGSSAAIAPTFLSASQQLNLPTSATMKGIEGQINMAVRALKPKNTLIAANTIYFAGDVTAMLPVGTGVVFFKEFTASGGFRHQYLMGTDDTLAVLEIDSVSYDSINDETELVVLNPDGFDLDFDLLASEYDEKLRVAPFDIQFESKGTLAAGYQTLKIQDIVTTGALRLPEGANTSGIFTEISSLTGSIIRSGVSASPSGQFYLAAVLERQASDVGEWHFYYSTDSGETFTKTTFTDNIGGATTWATENALAAYLPTPSVVVADNGKAFVCYSGFNGTLNYHVKGAYIDMSAVTPDMTPSAATGVDAENSVGTAGFIYASTANNRMGYVDGDRSDLSFVAFFGIRQNDTTTVRFWTNGGATYQGAEIGAGTHNYWIRPVCVVIGSGVSHRTIIALRNGANLQFRYYDQPSSAGVGNFGSTAGTFTIYDFVASGTKAYIFLRNQSSGRLAYLDLTTSGAPTVSALREITGTVDIDDYFGLADYENSPAQPYNHGNFNGRLAVISDLSDNQVLFAYETVHPDSIRRAHAFEVRDVTSFVGANISQLSQNVWRGLRDNSVRAQMGQTLTTSSSRFRTVSVRLRQIGSVPSGHAVTLEVQGQSGGFPDNLALATSENSYEADKITKDTNGQWCHFVVDTLNLTGSHSFVLKSTYPISASNYLDIAHSSANPYAGGTSARYDGVSWVDNTGEDFVFEINGEWIYDYSTALDDFVLGVDMWDQESGVSIKPNGVAQLVTRRASRQSDSFLPISGHVFKSDLTFGSGATTSVVTAPAQAGYGDYDPNLVFSVSLGSDESARKSVSTGVLSATDKFEDRSGFNVVMNGYNSANIVADGDFPSGFANEFNGTSSNILYQSSSSPLRLIGVGSVFAIEADIKMLSFAIERPIISSYRGTTASGGYGFEVNASGSVTFRASGGFNTTTSSTLSLNTRTVVTVTGDGDTIRIYFNGVEQPYATQTTGGYTISAANDDNGFVGVGSLADGGAGRFINARISSIKVIRNNTSFSYSGFSPQPPLTKVVPLQSGIFGEQSIGQNSTTSGVNFEVWGTITEAAGDAAFADSYEDQYYVREALDDEGNNPYFKINLNRGSEDNDTRIYGFNVRFNKSAPGTSGSGSGGALSDYYSAIVGSPAQVTSGVASHSTISAAIAASPSGGNILILIGTYSENVTINKTISIEGQGHGTNINGTMTFTAASEYSVVENLRIADNVTFQASSKGNWLTDSWIAATKTVTDLGTDNTFDLVEES